MLLILIQKHILLLVAFVFCRGNFPMLVMWVWFCGLSIHFLCPCLLPSHDHPDLVPVHFFFFLLWVLLHTFVFIFLPYFWPPQTIWTTLFILLYLLPAWYKWSVHSWLSGLRILDHVYTWPFSDWCFWCQNVDVYISTPLWVTGQFWHCSEGVANSPFLFPPGCAFWTYPVV